MTLWQTYRALWSWPLAGLTAFFALNVLLGPESNASDAAVHVDGAGIHWQWNNVANVALGVLLALGTAMPFAVWKLRGIFDSIMRRLEVNDDAHNGPEEHDLYLRRRREREE
jgi:hypothetical protein